jgi:hypothetical protein
MTTRIFTAWMIPGLFVLAIPPRLRVRSSDVIIANGARASNPGMCKRLPCPPIFGALQSRVCRWRSHSTFSGEVPFSAQRAKGNSPPDLSVGAKMTAQHKSRQGRKNSAG